MYNDNVYHTLLLLQQNRFIMTTNLLPPTPPLPEHISFTPCNFDYLSGTNRTFVKDAYDVISRKELWHSFRKELLTRGVEERIGFMFTNNPVYIKVEDAVASTKIGGLHSGASIGFVMREMEFIALHGEPEYKRICQTAVE